MVSTKCGEHCNTLAAVCAHVVGGEDYFINAAIGSERHILAVARELRQPQTPAEQKLWARLRDRQLAGFKLRRQHPIDRFIVDFYCADRKLCIEVEGDSHTEPEQIKYDQARTEYLNDEGYRVIRLTNHAVLNQIEAVLEAILDECNRPSP